MVRRVDADSVTLFDYLARGAHLKQVDIRVSRPGKGKADQTAAVYRLATVVLTNIKTTSARGGPTETIHGVFGALQFEVTPQKPNGDPGKTVTGSWNQVTNKESIPNLVIALTTRWRW